MREMRKCGVILLVAALLVSTTPGVERGLFAAQAGAAATQTQAVTIPTELGGKVFYPDGETPAAKVPVRVWSVKQKKFIHDTETDANGAYKLPNLPPERYVLVFGDRLRVDLLVVSAKEPLLRFLNVIIPRGVALLTPEQLAAQLAGEGAVAGGSLLTAVVIAVAGGALAVAIVAAAGGFGGGAVSP